MRRFHLGWWNEQLHLWGETSDAEFQVDASASNVLPRACRADVLVDLLDERSIDPQHESRTLVAWLPTVDGTAVPSSSVVGTPPPDDAERTPVPWRIPAVPLDPEAAAALLRACHGRDMLAPGQLLGGDVTYWSRVVRYAGALVAREQFLPGLQERDGTYRARWEPVVRGEEEADRFGALVHSMPSACRALSASNDAPPETPPRAVLQQVLGNLVDFVVRRGLRDRGDVRTADRAAASFDSLHDQWLHALRAPDGRMEGDDEELSHLAGQLRAWRRRIEVTAEAPFRLVFRLEEPGGSEEGEDIDGDLGPWILRYRLQSTDDPSLQIDVTEAWDPEPSTARVFERHDFQPGPYLLAALGQAMGVWPAIEGGPPSKRASRNRILPVWSWTPSRRTPSCGSTLRCCGRRASGCSCPRGGNAGGRKSGSPRRPTPAHRR